MNGYNYQSHTMSDDRQPPSIPSITSLTERPLSDASPNPSQLPPLNQSLQAPSTYLPPLSSRPSANGHQSQLQHPHYPSSKPANISQMTSQPPFGSHPYNPYATAYQHGAQQNLSSHTNYPHYSNGDSSHTTAHNFHAPVSQPSTFSEANHHDHHNLLPPFNPQPPQVQQNHAANESRFQDQRPLPVVGSQGRRGVLPSAPGRPSVTPGIEMRGQMASSAVKGSDGKYSCQYCSKVYLHLKHLKRHHLRHTGERPYQCSLCKETFCRSDILKRHFQKCSIRRGNPTGATHLTHAQAHLRRGSQPPSGSSTVSAVPHANGMGVSSQPAPPSSFRQNWPAGPLQTQAGQEMESARTSRSSSIVHRPGSSTGDRKSFASTAGTAPQTGATSLNTSPSSSSGEDRKYATSHHQGSRDHLSAHYQEPQPQQHQHSQHPTYSTYYGSAPQQFATSSQAESFPNFGYGQTNGYQYSQHSEPHRFGDHQWGGYQQYLQAGSSDPVMSYHQQ